jgi:hypothetical protein
MDLRISEPARHVLLDLVAPRHDVTAPDAGRRDLSEGQADDWRRHATGPETVRFRIEGDYAHGLR